MSSPEVEALMASAFKNTKKTYWRKRQRQQKWTPRDYPDVEVWTAEEKRVEDDECRILPDDPDWNAKPPNLNRKINSSDLRNCIVDGDDELAVISEHGQVACRDYPHPRHLCVQHPFQKISHEKYCPLCYCYICDVAAPCKSWAGASGHCHASDQSDSWKRLRKKVKKGLAPICLEVL